MLVPVAVQGKNGAPEIIYKRRDESAGSQVPRTIFSPTGNPSLAGYEGYGVTPPPSLDATTMDRVTGYVTALDLFKPVSKQIMAAKSMGPVAGRITLAEVEKLGGLGASSEDIKLAMALRRLVTEQAFANGGKQLTITERDEFVKLNPSLSDTVETALIKTQQSIDYLKMKLGNTIKVLPERQRNLMNDEIKAYYQSAQPTKAYKVGDTVKLKNGQTVTITKINPDGSFEY
jgi:hypothetical protein